MFNIFYSFLKPRINLLLEVSKLIFCVKKQNLALFGKKNSYKLLITRVAYLTRIFLNFSEFLTRVY